MLSAADMVPVDGDVMAEHAADRLAPRAYGAALRLYGRVKRRPVLLRAPLPRQIRRHLAEWLHREQLVLAWAVYVDATGRRFAAEMRALEPDRMHRCSLSSLIPPRVGEVNGRLWRLVHQGAMWPAYTVSDRWPDLVF